MENKKDTDLDTDKIKFIYEDNVLPSKDREASMYVNLNMWLNQLIKEVNNQDGLIEVYFKEHRQHVNFSEIAEPLREKLYKSVQQFQTPHNPYTQTTD